MADNLAVFVGDQRQCQRVARLEPFDDPARSLVAGRVIRECGVDDSIDFVFIAGSRNGSQTEKGGRKRKPETKKKGGRKRKPESVPDRIV
jgi:hypothetical protein